MLATGADNIAVGVPGCDAGVIAEDRRDVGVYGIICSYTNIKVTLSIHK
jgi:hypothetical protein